MSLTVGLVVGGLSDRNAAVIRDTGEIRRYRAITSNLLLGRVESSGELGLPRRPAPDAPPEEVSRSAKISMFPEETLQCV